MHKIAYIVVVLQAIIWMMASLQIASVAKGLPFATEGDLSIYTPPDHNVSLTSTDTTISWNGRGFTVWDYGVAKKVLPKLTLGGFIRSGSGHGHSGSSHYDTNGWDLWGTYLLVPEKGAYPSLTVGAEHLHENTALLLSTPTEYFYTAPSVDISGVELLAQAHRQQTTWLARAGAYSTSVFDADFAHVLLVGIGAEQRLSPKAVASVTLTQFHDDFNTSQDCYNLHVGIVYRPRPHVRLGLSSSFFPQGIPFAGDPLSAASADGTAVPVSTTATGLRTNHFGYVTVSGAVDF